MSRTVLVTGGGSGLGRAIASQFAQDGDRVHITGRRVDVLERTAAELGDTVAALPCDGTDPDAVERAVASIDGNIDVLVNNAGGNAERQHAPGGGLRGARDRWHANYTMNVITAMLMSEACRDRLASGGALVHIGSVAAEKGRGSYGAAKAALASLSMTLAQELGPRDITSNVVAPGYVPDTEFFGDGLAREIHDNLVSAAALDRHGHPEEIAAAVHFLASDRARFITGQVLPVNGGAFFSR